MESSRILSDYLNSLMRVQSNISLESFAREFPARTPIRLIEAIYNALVEQQESGQCSLVNRNIQSEFEFPMGDIFEAALQQVNSRELGYLTGSLVELKQNLTAQEKALDMEIQARLTEITRMAQRIGECTYNERDLDDSETVADSIKGIDRLSHILQQ